MEYRYFERKGFTFSEVLITLGIIGVVAVLTLTTVIPEIQNKQNIAKWKKEYSVINNAFNEVLADDVPICEYNQFKNCVGQSYTYEFLDAIQTKLRVVDYCSTGSYASGEHRCDYSDNDYWNKHAKYKWAGIVDTLSRYKALGNSSDNNSLVYGYNFNSLAVLLPDGASVYFGGLWLGPWIVVDVNNFQKGPNEFGRDVFVIHVYSNIGTNLHYMSPAGSKSVYVDVHTNPLNNPDYGITACSKDIGLTTSTSIYPIAGVGCSAKYLLE